MKTHNIPDLHIGNLRQDASDFLIIPIEELLKHFRYYLQNPHRPSYHQLLLIQDGTGEFQINSVKFSYTPETLIAVSKGQETTFSFGSETGGYALLFSDDFFYLDPENISWVNNLSLFNNSAETYTKVPSEREYMELLLWLRRIGNEFLSRENVSKDEILINMVRNILTESERAYKGIYRSRAISNGS